MSPSRKKAGSGMDRRTFLGTGAMATAGLFMGGARNEASAQDMRLTMMGGTVSTQSGRVRGLLKDRVHQFWGLPYGAPTGGANRFIRLYRV